MAPSLRRVAALLSLAMALLAGDAAAAGKRHEKLFEQAQVHFAEQRWADGLPLLERAVEAARREEGEASFALYDLQFKLAEVTNLAGRLDDAIVRMQEALVTLRKWPQRTSVQEAGHLHRLAQYHHAAGDHRARVDRLREAVRLVDGPDTQAHLPGYLVALADAMDDLGEMAETLPLLERALSMFEQGEQPAQIVETLNRIAIAREWIGYYDDALRDYRRAVHVAEASFGADHLQVANALNNLAQAITLDGRLREAETTYARAQTIAERHGEQGHYTLLAILQNLSTLWYLRGDPEVAVTLARRALELAETTAGHAHPSYAAALSGLAGKLAASQPDEALRIQRRVLALRQRSFGPDHPSVATTHARISEILVGLGRYEEAVAENARVLAIADKRLEPNHRLVVDALEREGVVRYEGGGEPAEATALLVRARRMGVEVHGERSLRVAAVDRHLARTAMLEGRGDRAVANMRRAIETEDAIVGELLGSGTDPQRRTLAGRLAETTSEVLDLHVSHLPDDEAARRMAAEVVLRRKGLALEVMTDRLARLRHAADPEPLRELGAARRRLAGLMLAVEADRERVDAERERVRRLEARLEKGEVLHPEPPDLDRVLAALRPNEALVEIQAYQPTGDRMVASGARRYAALVLRSDGVVGGRDLGRVPDIDALAREYLAAASDPARDPKPAARRLHAAVVEPLLPLIGDADHLRISPDGALFLVPFAGTIDAGGRLLLERFHISYLTTGREVLRRTANGASGAAVLIGAPDYGAVTPEGEAGDGPGLGLLFPPLPGTAREVRALAARLEPRMADVRILVGPDASETNVEALHRPALLHLATHGFFLGRPGSATTGQRGVRVARPGAASFGLEAQLRSALVFSGANEPASSTSDDGVLTAFEAATLDLEGTRLVVMSGCETGVGDVEAGEGVLGLRRAFALAGVETQLMSLWRVSDASTTTLMDRYYDALLSGAGRADALRDAQLSLVKREETAHPYHWAGFIVSGQPGPIFESSSDVPPVAPSSRGCACEVGSPPRSDLEVATVALLVVTMARRRRRDRSARRDDPRRGSRTPRTP